MKILDRPVRQEEHAKPGAQAAVVMSVPVALKISAEGTFLDPDLEGKNFELSIVGKWWVRPWLILPGLGGFSRKDVILGVADKEGGAHVDLDRSKRLDQLFSYRSLHVGWCTPSPFELCRYMTGQAGAELLDCLDRNFHSQE